MRAIGIHAGRWDEDFGRKGRSYSGSKSEASVEFGEREVGIGLVVMRGR